MASGDTAARPPKSPKTCKPERPHPKSDKVIFGYEDPSKNLFKNWSFDDPISEDDWRITKADATRCPDSHSGKWSLHVHSRKHKHGQAYQRLYGLKQNSLYYISCFIKFVSHPEDRMYFGVRVFIFIKFPDSDVKKKQKVCWLTFQRAPCEWQQLGGDFRTPDEPFEYIETHMEIDPADVDFLLDTSSLIELAPEPNWRETTDEMIEKHRKSDVKLKISLPKGRKANDFEIRVTQKKRDFAFGSAIVADAFNAEESQNYRECFFKHFEWAVFCNDTKWRLMEKRKGNIRLDRVDKAIQKLHERGVTVRGHAIHWNNKKNCPDWLHEKEGAELQEEIDRRLDYVVEHFKGRLVQWDVCNETLHNRYFEETTGKHDQLEHLFRRAHEIDPSCQLYLNDYLVFRDGALTSGHLNLAKHLLSAGAPLHGIGVQSHLKNLPKSYEQLKKRVEVISAAGLPIMVTELSLHADDVRVRAEGLEMALHLYFSQPAVHGVIFWNFSDQPGITMGSDMPLFEGPEFEPNEAGLMLQKLLAQWRTNISFTPKKRQVRERFRAFHGQYELEVLRDGKVVWGQTFTVHKGKDLELDLDVELEEEPGTEGGECQPCVEQVAM